jgi:hypothetical protein
MKMDPNTIVLRRAERHGKIIFISSQLYGIAKVFLEFMERSCAEVRCHPGTPAARHIIDQAVPFKTDDSPTDIKFYMDRYEFEIVRSSSTNLLAITEHLFYIVYARIKTEIQHMELGESFGCELYAMRAGHVLSFDKVYPKQKQLLVIFRAFQRFLKYRIADTLNIELTRQQQAVFVADLVKTAAGKGLRFKDTPENRHDLLGQICNPKSPYYTEFEGLDPCYDAAPAMMIATLAEKYLSFQEGNGRNSAGSGSGTKTEEKDPWSDKPGDRERYIMAHRQGAYAKLCGVTIAVHRRTETDKSVRWYVEKGLCVCIPSCLCSKQCTEKPHRVCPCNTRLNWGGDFNEDDFKASFSERCQDGASIIFKKLAEASRASGAVEEMADSLAGLLEVFPREVVSHREQYREWMSRLHVRI